MQITLKKKIPVIKRKLERNSSLSFSLSFRCESFSQSQAFYYLIWITIWQLFSCIVFSKLNITYSAYILPKLLDNPWATNSPGRAFFFFLVYVKWCHHSKQKNWDIFVKNENMGPKNLGSSAFFHSEGSFIYRILKNRRVHFALVIPINFGTLWTSNLKKVDYYHFVVYSKPIFIIALH